jgi:hypothetical protein
MPLCPSSRAFQVSSAPVAIEVVMAMPVTTTLGRPFPVLRPATWDELIVVDTRDPHDEVHEWLALCWTCGMLRGTLDRRRNLTAPCAS